MAAPAAAVACPVCRYDFPAFGRVMAVYVVPTAAGHCRMITRFIKNKKTFARRPGLMGLFLKVGDEAAGMRICV